MLWDEFKDLAKEALENCGSYEELNDEIGGWVTEDAAKRWYKEGCLAGIDMLDELIEAYHDLDFYGAIVSTGPDSYSYRYRKPDATRYRNGQFLKDLVVWAYQSWFMQQVWQIEKERDDADPIQD